MLGDCRVRLKELADNSIDSIVTDPPYELGFMGKSWDSTGVAYDVTVWQECLRVLKPGGHLLAFGGSRTYHRLAVAIEDAGFQIRDQIMWVYGSGFPKSLNIGKQDGCEVWNGWGTALKPAHEPIVMARKPLVGTVANNVLTYGVGGINIDGSKVGRADGDDSSAGNRTATFGTQDTLGGGDGSGGWSQNEQGRFPANFIHDGSDEVLQLFPDTGKSTPSKGHLRKGNTVGDERTPKGAGLYGDGAWIAGSPHNDSGSAARFFYCAKASKKDRNEGLEGFEVGQAKGGGGGIGDYLDDVNSASGKYGSEKAPQRNHHPTVKPTDLMRYLCRLITPPNGTVLDPFTGSGSTGKAAVLEGFNFIGVEQSEEYLAIAKARVNSVYDSRP